MRRFEHDGFRPGEGRPFREGFGHGGPCRGPGEGRHPHEGHCHRHEFPAPEDLEGMLMACAWKLRRGRRNHFGSTQDRILTILKENGGTMGQKALQELLHVRPGSISEILGKMEEKGLIERSKDEDDRRASLISLKDEDFKAEEKDRFMMLEEEEKETLKAILKKILDHETENEE